MQILTNGKPARAEWAAVMLLLACFAGVLVSLAWKTGVTVDEPSHLVSAHLYWAGKDRLAPQDMPPAIKIVGGWVSHLTGLPIPPRNDSSWKNNHEWEVGIGMMLRMDPKTIQRTFFFSRLPMLLFPLSCAAMLWWWGRQMYGPGAALVTVFLFCLSPTVLAHGCLFKNDLAASLGLLLMSYNGWVCARRPGWRGVARFSGAVAFAVLTKLSMLALAFLAPLFLVFVAWRQGLGWKGYLRSVGILAGIVYCTVLVLWPGEIGPLPAIDWAWIQSMHLPAPFEKSIAVLRFIPLSNFFWHGAATIASSNTGGVGVYMLGQIYPGGHPLYFLVAWAVKVPVTLQILLVAGIGAWLVRWRKHRSWDDAYWLVPAFLYAGLASMSSLQLGIRLVLPAIVCARMSIGRGVSWLGSHQWGRVAVAALAVLQVVRTGMSYPNYISYFNLWTKPQLSGPYYLSDSNLDWGQGLHDLRIYMDEHKVEKLNLFYFGNDNAWVKLPEERVQMMPIPWSPGHVKEDVFTPQPGLYAVSASLLTGQLFERRFKDYMRRFREMSPEAIVGGSIYIYRVK